MREQIVRVTDVDSRRLQSLIDLARVRDARDAGSIVQLEAHLDDADVTPAARISRFVVTMNSEVLVSDLATGERFRFHLVFPRLASAEEGRISVLAPLGMAVLGRQVGDEITWKVPGGLRHLRVDDIFYQPERAGRDLA
jgi:regulator of nucleoside diphosphate kinase